MALIFIHIPDPRSLGAVQLITSVPTKDQGSVDLSLIITPTMHLYIDRPCLSTDPRPIGHMHTYYKILSYQPNGSGISAVSKMAYSNPSLLSYQT